MAQKTVVSLIDDLDGHSEADETVEYALGVVTYEIDLATDNAEALREVFAPYIAAARRTGGRARSGAGARRRSSASSGAVATAAGRGREAMKAIRDWAKSSGLGRQRPGPPAEQRRRGLRRRRQVAATRTAGAPAHGKRRREVRSAAR